MRLLFVILLGFTGLAVAQDVTSFEESLKQGKLILNMRLRAETVDQDLINKDAAAFTLRTRLGYKTAPYKGVSFLIDFENVTAADEDSYNSTTNGQGNRPVVADPELNELNQAYLKLTTFKDQVLTLGRQRIILDNARFVGNVGWRQNEQTFDALNWAYKGWKNTTLSLVYLNNANRIFGDDHPAGDLPMDSFIVHGHLAKLPIGDLSVFAHFVELTRSAAGSHRNLGFRLTGNTSISEGFSLGHELSYADQSSYKDGSDLIDANYYNLALAPKWGALTLKLNYELLSGDGTYGFATPLATLHAFNGWADKFLGTPANGLQDLSLALIWAKNGWKCLGTYHTFDPDEGSGSYGNELDLLVSKKLGKRCSGALKLADYSADDFATDTTKIWAFTQYKW